MGDAVRLLGVKIAHGYSSEVRVFAGLLRHRTADVDAVVLYHDSPHDHEEQRRFAHDAAVRTLPVDTGWRGWRQGLRFAPAKALSHLRFALARRQMVRQALDLTPDVIYSSQQKWDCRAATEVALRLRRPQIIHLHYNVGPWLGRPVLQRLRECDHVVTVSDFIREQVLRHDVPGERVTTIRNAMAPLPPPRPGTREGVRAELCLPADAVLVGIVSRLDPFKGHRDVIQAFCRVAPAYPAARLLVVGDGGLRRELEEQAAGSGLGERILFTGFRGDVARLLGAMDVFIHPSKEDPCPLAVLEAAAAGLPIVAYAEGGVTEIVSEGRSGLLAPPEDADGLAERLRTLVGDLDLARAMGAAGRSRIEREFRPEDTSRRFGQLLHAVGGRR